MDLRPDPRASEHHPLTVAHPAPTYTHANTFLDAGVEGLEHLLLLKEGLLKPLLDLDLGIGVTDLGSCGDLFSVFSITHSGVGGGSGGRGGLTLPANPGTFEITYPPITGQGTIQIHDLPYD